ncbi:bifunctional non-homologous end joining protein LigD [Flavobacteriaceae bacterium MAR_2010_188]|nr:bifunctional non-homologous end joining protein LigD [Flavobacteriaceae bacterium MAR_2010_188]
MPLGEYNKKRDFKSTQEPEGVEDLSNKWRFVIQRHQASRLHYDLRLEIEGVLKSWAIPKGPSMNPKDKRLAVQTEDHPVKYLTFKGDIPKGNYGAGHMDIWDSGTFSIYEEAAEGPVEKQFKKGNLKVEFFGKKVKGKFALVKTRQEGKQQHWLLIKKQDDFSTDLHYDSEIFVPVESQSNSSSPIKKLDIKGIVKPMLAESATEIFADPNWIYEFKWDGYRMISQIKNGKVEMYSRNGINYNSKFAKVHQELSAIPHDVILDGEIVITDGKGLPKFQKLQNYDPQGTKGRLMYYVFDVLHLNGHDTIELPLLDRKSLLPEILEGLEHVVLCDHIEAMGIAFYERAVKLGMEGVIAKKSDSKYSPGFRSKDWLKIKEIDSTEALICGYTTGSGRGKLFGSLILGQYRNDDLVYIGNVGSGFNSKEQKDLMKMFQPLETEKSSFNKKPNLKGREPHWMTPQLLCEVNFTEWTKSGVLRHPTYKGLRFDKLNPVASRTSKNIKPEKPKDVAGNLDVSGIKVPFTNLDKIYWPESGFRKYDLIDYYLKVSDFILPYLKDRPQNLHRHPNGINKEGFYQKDNEFLPDWADSVSIYSKSAEKEINYLLCNNEATLLYMANLGCIEINPWSSRIVDLDKPDYTVIDIDPSDKNTFDEVLECARVAKEILDQAQVEAYCKTTGKSGLHIFIPLGGKYSYDEARTFTQLLCVYINERLPKLTSLERAVMKRKNQIYLDFMQNRRGQTLASAYCARPVEGARVSTPVSWKEIEKGFEKEEFTILTLPKRLASIGDIFIGVVSKGINMEHALSNLS